MGTGLEDGLDWRNQTKNCVLYHVAIGNCCRPHELGNDMISAMFERNHFSKMICKENRLDTGKAIQRIYYYHPEIINRLSLNLIMEAKVDMALEELVNFRQIDHSQKNI